MLVPESLSTNTGLRPTGRHTPENAPGRAPSILARVRVPRRRELSRVNRFRVARPCERGASCRRRTHRRETSR